MKATELNVGDKVLLNGLKTLKHYRGEIPGQVIDFGVELSGVVTKTYKPKDESDGVCIVKIDPQFRQLFRSFDMTLMCDDEVDIV